MSLLELQKTCQGLPLARNATGQVGSREYKYLTLGALHDAVLPVIHEKGFVWVTQPSSDDDGNPTLEYGLCDGESNDVVIGDSIPLLGCKDMQTLGSAITYARRYALLSVLGLAPDEDDDGAATATQTAPKPSGVPEIPLDRARSILEAAQAKGLADGTELKSILKAKLVDVGVVSGRIGHLNVDQAEAVEAWIGSVNA